MPDLNLSQSKSARGTDMRTAPAPTSGASQAEIVETIFTLPRVMTPRKLCPPKTLLHNQLRTNAREVTAASRVGRGVALAQW